MFCHNLFWLRSLVCWNSSSFFNVTKLWSTTVIIICVQAVSLMNAGAGRRSNLHECPSEAIHFSPDWHCVLCIFASWWCSMTLNFASYAYSPASSQPSLCTFASTVHVQLASSLDVCSDPFYHWKQYFIQETWQQSVLALVVQCVCV